MKLCVNLPVTGRFWNWVAKTDSCWLWKGPAKTGGYGNITILGRKYAAHRVSWLLHNGPIPAGLCVLHRCDNPPCVNPDHLFLGTDKDNVTDCLSKGRFKGGASLTHCSKGHEFSPDNTYYTAKGFRSCKTCTRNRAFRIYHATHTTKHT